MFPFKFLAKKGPIEAILYTHPKFCFPDFNKFYLLLDKYAVGGFRLLFINIPITIPNGQVTIIYTLHYVNVINISYYVIYIY